MADKSSTVKELDTEEYERQRTAEYRALAFRLMDAGQWHEEEPYDLDRIITCSRLECVARLDDEAGTLLQIFRDENGYTLYGLATTSSHDRIVTLMTESSGYPVKRGLDQVLDHMRKS